MIRLTEDVINFEDVTNSVRDVRAGAVVLFLGTVREITGSDETSHLFYEAYPEMAIRCMHELADEAKQRFPIQAVAIVHRTGTLGPGDVSVAIAVSTPHRAQAFEAGQWLIDSLKERVPIWKQESYKDGRVDWVHPGLDAPAAGKEPS
ncbi:MAG: molybdenum cofactor biosynthesis protein MoaE [Planctomyces sp.]|nr:molybdenum cofactor biosynthesis protein MoaE [Planctomyces sp.]